MSGTVLQAVHLSWMQGQLSLSVAMCMVSQGCVQTSLSVVLHLVGPVQKSLVDFGEYSSF